MNTLLLELVAARAAESGNPMVADILARMRRDGDTNNNQNEQERLAEHDHGDPAARLVAKYVADQKAAALACEQPSIIHVEPANDAHDSARNSGIAPAEGQCSSDAMRELRFQVESMFAELKEHRERMDQVAWALGACCLCWGKDADCRICRGRGCPGFAMPDEKLFAELILPAVRVLRAQAEKRNGTGRHSPPRVTDPGASPNPGAHQNERNAI